MFVERIFEVPPLQLQKKLGLRPGYLFYVQQGDSSIEGCGPTLQAAILDMRSEKRRLRTRTWKSQSKIPSWRS